jgi:DNA-binding NarL/FixJ family response regulator
MKILIATEHDTLGQAWADYLAQHVRWKLDAIVCSPQKAASMVEREKPSFILLDIHLLGSGGLALLAAVHRSAAGGRIIVLTGGDEPAFYLRRLLDMGTNVLLSRKSGIEELPLSLRNAKQGSNYISPVLEHLLSSSGPSDEAADNLQYNLSSRQLQVAKYIVEGKTSKEIAALVSLSVKTVETHRYKLLKKMKMNSSAALVNFFTSQQSPKGPTQD